MIIDHESINEKKRINFTEAWIESSAELPRKTRIRLKTKGIPHPVSETAQTFREVLIEAGFEEVINRTIIPENEVLMQYGPEAKLILDRIFYIAKLPRIELGFGKDLTERIREIIGDFDAGIMQEIFRDYKRGEIEADDLIEELSKRLKKDQAVLTELLSKDIFSQMLLLKPRVTDMTLRSHMTAGWFATLAEVQHRDNQTKGLFSVGLRYRNEQREDASHIRVHSSASFVIMDSEMSLEAGEEISKDILKQIGFEDVRFEQKDTTSTYYAYDQEKEAFVMHEGEWWEIGDIGMYSPLALSEYEIAFPVFNAGFGIERIAAILSGSSDIRKLVFHCMYEERDFSDDEIRRSVNFVDMPVTELGAEIARSIEKTAGENESAKGPCCFKAFSGKGIEVFVAEEEDGKKLLGPAALNELNIGGGEIFSTLKREENAIGINYLSAVSLRAARRIEDFLETEEREMRFQVKMVKHLSDINIEVEERVMDWMCGKHKKIAVGGPLFITVIAKKTDI